MKEVSVPYGFRHFSKLAMNGLNMGGQATGYADASSQYQSSFGQHACRVELDDGIVQSATCNFAD